MSSFDAFFKALMGQESGGNYKAVNGRTGAMGAYQILPSNIGPWSQQYLGYKITPSQFLNSPALQDKLAKAVLTAQFNKYGAAGAASWWYSGSASNVNSTKSSHGEPSVADYVKQILGRMGGDYGLPVRPTSITDNTVKDSALEDLLKPDSTGPTMDALVGVDRGGLGLGAETGGTGLEAAAGGLGTEAPQVTGSQPPAGPNKATVADAAAFSTSQVAEGLAASGALGDWLGPLKGGKITSQYGLRNGRQHTGLDFGAAMGTPLVAMNAGVVVFVGPRGNKGNVVRIRYADGTESLYAHMQGFNVKVGQQVTAGQVVGTVGNTGHSTGPHLHLEVRNAKGDLMNPLDWLRKLGLA